MKPAFQKLQRESATTDCNGKVLPLEGATGRWKGGGGREREFETEKTTGSSKWESVKWVPEKLQKA